MPVTLLRHLREQQGHPWRRELGCEGRNLQRGGSWVWKPLPCWDVQDTAQAFLHLGIAKSFIPGQQHPELGALGSLQCSAHGQKATCPRGNSGERFHGINFPAVCNPSSAAASVLQSVPVGLAGRSTHRCWTSIQKGPKCWFPPL